MCRWDEKKIKGFPGSGKGKSEFYSVVFINVQGDHITIPLQIKIDAIMYKKRVIVYNHFVC